MDFKRLLKLKNEDGTPNPIARGIWLTLVLFVIVIAIFLFWLLTSGVKTVAQTEIDNLDDYASEMCKTSRQGLFVNLYNAIKLNLPEDQQPPRQGALIREGTYEQEYYEETQIYASDFVVDLAELEQTYRVNLFWVTDEENPNLVNYTATVSCPRKSDIIYPNFDCKQSEETTATVDSPLNYLPYQEMNEDKTESTFRITNPDSDPEWILVSMQTCGDSELEKVYKERAMKWLKESTTIDLDKYKLRFKTTCDGMAV